MSEPLFRLSFDTVALLRDYPLQLRDPGKQLLLKLAYPEGLPTPATLEVTRWLAAAVERVTLTGSMKVSIQPNYYDYRPLIGEEGVEWHVNFADSHLFVAYGSRLFAQDEMQVAEHPLLGSVREALLSQRLPALTDDVDGPTPILVRNVERRISVATDINPAEGRPHGLYGNRFSIAPPEVIQRATTRIDPPTFSNMIAMAAPSYGHGAYTEGQIRRIFVTAFTSFAAARAETPKHLQTVIHSGFWGCGAFGGNRTVMIAIQSLAAEAAGISQLVFHGANVSGQVDVEVGLDAARKTRARCGHNCDLSAIVHDFEQQRFAWGVSDGN